MFTTNGESSWREYFSQKLVSKQDTEWFQTFVGDNANGLIQIKVDKYYRKVAISNIL